ncbi:MAG: hypothetical protein HY843_09305 [Bdellovibrio sp.]|nr:hypothetical protein [Bdellovibrio sp.]
MQFRKNSILILAHEELVFSLLVQKLKENFKTPFHVFSSGEAIVDFVRKIGTGVIVCFATEADDLVKQVVILKQLKAEIKNKNVKILLLHSFIPEKVYEKFKFFGFTELLLISTEFDKILSMLSKMCNEKSNQLSVVSGLKNPQKEEFFTQEIKKVELKIRMVPALNLEEDYWLFQSGGTRVVMNRWVVKLKGPGPSAGKWILATENQELEKWKWIPENYKKYGFKQSNGAWYFIGELPRFEKDAWKFIGQVPELVFCDENDKALGTKVLTDLEGNLIVSYDSLNAIHSRDAIEETYTEEELEAEDSIKEARAYKEQLGEFLHSKLEQTLAPQKIEKDEVAFASDYAGKRGPRAIQAIKGDAPVLGSLAMAFLVSELCYKKEYNLKQMSDRFCDYLEAACGGLKVELWCFSQGRWRCGGTSTHEEGIHEEYLSGIKEGVAKFGEEILIGAINSEDNSCLGALVVYGNGAALIPAEYILSIGKIANGLCLGLTYSTDIIDESFKTAA